MKTKGKLLNLSKLTLVSNCVFRNFPSIIIVQRSGMKDGFACNGDSGGPIVVKSSGRFVLAAVASTISIDFLPGHHLVIAIVKEKERAMLW